MEYLILEDGSQFSGKSFGSPPPRADELEPPDGLESGRRPAGELVFNTGMAGYQEILTDQSYSGQIVVMTYPHIGNYGTDAAWNEFLPPDEAGGGFEAAGLVVRSLYRGPLPPGRGSLDDFLKGHRVSGISEVDTRAVTLKIRNQGNPIGLIVAPRDGGTLSRRERDLCIAYLHRFPRMEGRDLATRLGTRRRRAFGEGGSPHLCLVDCGAKSGIIHDLVGLGCRVTMVPNGISAPELTAMPSDAVLFSNGPGDPSTLTHLIELAGELIPRKPVFGICLGHQIICLALGAKCFKMKFGHHGVNSPVRDEESGRILITSQNHGFAVDEASLPPEGRVWFRNVNDGTVEGIKHRELPVVSVQFHPEARPGPRDSGWIFHRFLDALESR